MKKIPLKNYFIVGFLIIFTIFLTFYLMKKYDSVKVKEINFVSEVKENELDSYITERQEVIIYMASSNNKGLDTFNKDLKNIQKIKT